MEIPLEYPATALDWLRAHPAVRAGRPTVMGRSYGGQLALLLGAMYPDLIGAVVACSPSAVVTSGIRRGGTGLADASPWSHLGHPLPYLRICATPAQMADIFAQAPIATTPVFEIGLADSGAVARAAIPVERIAGPVLLISGRADAMWPSAPMAEMVMGRLREHRHPSPAHHLSYAGAGHALSAPYPPTTVAVVRHRVGNVMVLGGNPVAQANHDSWRRVLIFLGDAAGRS